MCACGYVAPLASVGCNDWSSWLVIWIPVSVAMPYLQTILVLYGMCVNNSAYLWDMYVKVVVTRTIQAYTQCISNQHVIQVIPGRVCAT